ncbi:MAG TPA: winged helix-turn-helix domain-containing protein, partial [Xanthomonadales bacterium]|nr:winged helix-turn-helix domain-containing protein [Xanthomonadales bacterium]
MDSGAVFRLQDLEFDPTTGQVNGPAGQVRLEPRVMALLQMLASTPGVLVSRAELLREIWPGNGVYDEALTQCIYQLRQQLSEAGGEKCRNLIKTVPKRGYVLQGEITPGETQQPEPPDQPTETGIAAAADTKNRSTLWRGGVVLVLVLALAIAFYSSRTPEPSLGGVHQVQSIAVLPFLPLLDEQRDIPLELGMADSLITRLSAIPQVVVRPINAVRRFNSLERDGVEIGKLLKVDAVIDGTIQRSGDKLRVTARLLRIEDGAALWADSFNAEFSRVFSLQDQICQQIAASLSPELKPAFARSSVGGTQNTEAYELFLKGRYLIPLLTRADLFASRDYFQQAVILDPDYAQAWLGLASVNFRLPLAGEVPPGEHYALAREAALKALAI